jgi:hypothetical protein
MSETEPTRVVIGFFGEGLPNVLVIPKGDLKPAERILDAESTRRGRVAFEAKMEPLRAARARGPLEEGAGARFQSETGPMSERADGAATRLVARKPEYPGPTFEIRNNLRVVLTADPRGGPPPGSIDLRGIVYPASAAEDWGKAARIQDVITSILAAETMLAGVMGELLAKHLNDLQDILEKKITGLDARLVMMELENGALKSENASLRRDIAMVDRRLSFNLERQAASVGRPSRKAAEGRRLRTMAVAFRMAALMPRNCPTRSSAGRRRRSVNGPPRPAGRPIEAASPRRRWREGRGEQEI